MEIYISEYNKKMVAVLLDDEMKIVKPVYDFLRFQQQKGRATNTLKAYGTDLCLFWTFLKKNGYAYDQVTPRLIADFIDYLRGGDKMLSLYRESNRSNRTINRILSTVHSFYQYQADMHEIDNPILMHEINRPFNMFKAQVGVQFNFHDLRHTFCSNLVESGLDVSVVRIIMGHEHISTTQRYTHLSNHYIEDSLSRYWGQSSLIGDDFYVE